MFAPEASGSVDRLVLSENAAVLARPTALDNDGTMAHLRMSPWRINISFIYSGYIERRSTGTLRDKIPLAIFVAQKVCTRTSS